MKGGLVTSGYISVWLCLPIILWHKFCVQYLFCDWFRDCGLIGRPSFAFFSLSFFLFLFLSFFPLFSGEWQQQCEELRDFLSIQRPMPCDACSKTNFYKWWLWQFDLIWSFQIDNLPNRENHLIPFFFI